MLLIAFNRNYLNYFTCAGFVYCVLLILLNNILNEDLNGADSYCNSFSTFWGIFLPVIIANANRIAS